MLVSIQFICIAISIVFAATMLFATRRNVGWMQYRDGLVRDLMFAFVVFTFLLTLLITVVIRPY